MKKSFVDLGLQIVSVMIGVFLGVIASDYREAEQAEKNSEKLLTIIRAEIATNQNIIEQVIDYHHMLRDSASYYADNQDIPAKPTFFKGSRMSYLSSSAYETGVQTGIINELPLNDIQMLNHVYTLQEAYNDLGKTILNGFVNQDFRDSDENRRNIATFLAITMSDVVVQEQGLLQEYERLLGSINE